MDDKNYEVFHDLDFPDSGDNSLRLQIDTGTVADYGRNDEQYRSWQEHKKPAGKVYKADHPPLDSKKRQHKEFRHQHSRQILCKRITSKTRLDRHAASFLPA